MSFPFTHAKTTNLDIYALDLKFIDIIPWFYLKSKNFAFGKRLVQEQISFKNKDVICVPPFLTRLINSL